jgi:hypothetical protein
MPYTNRQKAECAKREVRQRVRAYPRWIEEHRMTHAFAALQIGIMQEIADDYEAKAIEDEKKELLL